MRKIIIIAMSLILGFAINNTVIKAEETVVSKEKIQQEIEISEKNFPDQLVRESILKYIDKDNNKYLSQEEIDNTEELYIDAYEEIEFGYFHYNDENDYGTIDCKGLEIFKNTKSLTLVSATISKPVKKYEIKNIECIYQLKKIEGMYVEYDSGIKEWNFAEFPELKTIELRHISNMDNIIMNNPQLKKITIFDVGGKAKMNVSQSKNLKVFYATEFGLQGVKFGKNNIKLSYFTLNSSQGKKNTSVRELDFSKLKSIKKIDLDDMAKLEKINFGKNPKLKKLFICGSKIKMLDLSKNKSLNAVNVCDNKKLRKIKLNKNNRIKSLSAGRNRLKKMSDIQNLNKSKIEYLSILGNKIKKVNIKGFKKLALIDIDAKVKIFKSKGQKTKVRKIKRVDIYKY